MKLYYINIKLLLNLYYINITLVNFLTAIYISFKIFNSEKQIPQCSWCITLQGDYAETQKGNYLEWAKGSHDVKTLELGNKLQCSCYVYVWNKPQQDTAVSNSSQQGLKNSSQATAPDGPWIAKHPADFRESQPWSRMTPENFVIG